MCHQDGRICDGKEIEVLYDGDCPLCRRAVAWIRHRVAPGSLDFVPCLSEERTRRFPHILQQDCMKEMFLVLPDGCAHAGERALPHLLRMMRGWRWFAYVFRLPLAASLAPCAYKWIARHRYMISVIVAKNG